MEYMCAISEIEGSWPMSISSLFMNIFRIDVGIQTRIYIDYLVQSYPKCYLTNKIKGKQIRLVLLNCDSYY